MPNDRSAERRARYWLVRQHAGDMSEEEQEAFHLWLDAAPENREAYGRASAIWDLVGQFGDRDFPARRAARQIRRIAALPWAASLAAVTVLGALVLGVGAVGERGEPEAYRTARGEQREIVLRDGTLVRLNTDTDLRVAYSRGARTLHLERGQAAFTVEADVDRPFTVVARNARITDLGTRFDVHLGDEQTRVAVVEGLVRVTTDRTGPVHIGAGEGLSLSLRGDFLGRHPVDPRTAVAWQEGRLHFDRTPLAEVLAEVGRYHPLAWRFAEPALARLPVSGTFRHDEPDALLEALEAALPITIRRDGQRLQIVPAPS